VYQSSNLNLAVLITATGDDVFTKVRFTVSDLESKFFESEGTVAARIEEAVQFLTKELSGFENLQVLLSVWQENVLYLVSKKKNKTIKNSKKAKPGKKTLIKIEVKTIKKEIDAASKTSKEDILNFRIITKKDIKKPITPPQNHIPSGLKKKLFKK